MVKNRFKGWSSLKNISIIGLDGKINTVNVSKEYTINCIHYVFYEVLGYLIIEGKREITFDYLEKLRHG